MNIIINLFAGVIFLIGMLFLVMFFMLMLVSFPLLTVFVLFFIAFIWAAVRLFGDKDD